MKQKTRILIYILIGAAIVIVGTIIMFAKDAADKKPYVGIHIDLGQKYLIELSYDKAVLEFTEAIEIEPQNPEAYKGLALTYSIMGDKEKAVEWLRKGYDLTGDSSLQGEIDRINAYIQPTETSETTVTTAVTTTVTTTEATTTVTTEKMFTVPDLIGLSKADAVSACEMAEIPYAILTEESDSVEKGFVVSQRIPASAKVKEGVELVFVVSEGKKIVTTAATAEKHKIQYAEQFLGMTVKEVTEILGEGKITSLEGGFGLIWFDPSILMFVYQDTVSVVPADENRKSLDKYYQLPMSEKWDVIIPDDACIGGLCLYDDKLPLNSDLRIGMTILEAVENCGQTKDDIVTSLVRPGYFIDNNTKYNYSVGASTRYETDYNEPIVEISAFLNDYGERCSVNYY